MIFSQFLFFACEEGPEHHRMGNWSNGIDLDSRGVIWLILLIIIGIVIYWQLSERRSKNNDASIVETPLEILKKRYSKGEIDKEEFEQKKKDLEL